MTVPNTDAQDVQENKPNDKEMNFRLMEAKYERQLAQERAARLEAERIAEETRQAQQQRAHDDDDDDDDDEPYVNKKKLNKQLKKFGEQNRQTTQSEIQKAVDHALREKERQDWLKNNPDFYQVLQHADKFAEMDPELAETILEMPEGFKRQKLVYKNIKALGLHQEKKTSIQDTINQKQQGQHYRPTGIGTHPYGAQADYSEAGQKNAYEKVQSLLNRKRY